MTTRRLAKRPVTYSVSYWNRDQITKALKMLLKVQLKAIVFILIKRTSNSYKMMVATRKPFVIPPALRVTYMRVPGIVQFQAMMDTENDSLENIGKDAMIWDMSEEYIELVHEFVDPLYEA
jgi:hypothetical protein